MRREAHAAFQIALNDQEDRSIYQDNVKVIIADDSKSAMDVSIFGSPDDLRAVAVEAMSRAIDQALDKPGFRTALVGHQRADQRITNNNS